MGDARGHSCGRRRHLTSRGNASDASRERARPFVGVGWGGGGGRTGTVSLAVKPSATAIWLLERGIQVGASATPPRPGTNRSSPPGTPPSPRTVGRFGRVITVGAEPGPVLRVSPLGARVVSLTVAVGGERREVTCGVDDEAYRGRRTSSAPRSAATPTASLAGTCRSTARSTSSRPRPPATRSTAAPTASTAAPGRSPRPRPTTSCSPSTAPTATRASPVGCGPPRGTTSRPTGWSSPSRRRPTPRRSST